MVVRWMIIMSWQVIWDGSQWAGENKLALGDFFVWCGLTFQYQTVVRDGWDRLKNMRDLMRLYTRTAGYNLRTIVSRSSTRRVAGRTLSSIIVSKERQVEDESEWERWWSHWFVAWSVKNTDATVRRYVRIELDINRIYARIYELFFMRMVWLEGWLETCGSILTFKMPSAWKLAVATNKSLFAYLTTRNEGS